MARSVSWGRVLLAALLASLITFVLMHAAVYGFRYAGVTGDNLALVAELVGGPGAALAFFLVVLYRARHSALGAGEWPGAHAVAIGALSALSLQLLFALLAPPVYASETLLYLALGLAAGALASRLVRRRLATRGLLYRASARMRENPDHEAIASIIGRAMATSRPDSVILWERPRGPQAGSTEDGTVAPLLPRGAWVAPTSPPLPVDDVGDCAEGLEDALAAGGRWALVNVRRAGAGAGAAWRRRGVGQILVVALRDTPAPPGVSALGSERQADGGDAEAPAGLLAVGLRVRTHIPAATREDYLFLAQQAAGVLETARLLQNARDEARRITDHENRTRLAQELHDTIKNRWLGVGMLAEAGLAAVSDDPRFAGLREQLELIRQEVVNATRQQRAIIARMRWPQEGFADDRPLEAYLEARAQWWSQASDVKLSFAAVGAPDHPHPDVLRRHLEPILEEALANVAAHSRASAVRVTLAGGAAGADDNPGTSTRRTLTLTVADNGVGGAVEGPDTYPAGAAGGWGIRGMRARAWELGGSLTVDSPPGGGTTVTVAIPAIPAARRDDHDERGRSQ